MPLKVNVHILHRHPDEIVRENDKDYQQFLYWAERKDRKQGLLICEVVEAAEGDTSEIDTSETDGEEVPIETKETEPFVCEICGFKAKNEDGLKIHMSKAHKE
jgi:hypothetical protein